MKIERPWGFYINLYGVDNSGSKVKNSGQSRIKTISTK